MGLFFKDYIVEFEVNLTDGTSGRGKINLRGTILSDVSDIQPEICMRISKSFGADVIKFTKYKIYEV